MRIRTSWWLSVVLPVFAGNSAFAQPICDAGGPYQQWLGAPITFDGTGSSSPVGILSYAWDFGDGSTGSGPTPEHIYTDVGDFTVTLTVLDNNQQSVSCQAVAYVYTETGTPSCDAAGPYNGIVNVPLEFDGSGSSMPGGTIVFYAWDFGDGATGTGAKPAHAYVAAGTYTVTLTVTEDQGASSTCATTVQIVGEPGTPICDPGGPYNGAVNQPIQFDGTGSSDPQGGSITAYDWDFGDGATGTGPAPQHAYASINSFMITLVVHDERGGTSACIGYVLIRPLAVESVTWGRIKSVYR